MEQKTPVPDWYTSPDWFSLLKGILSDCVGFIYRVLPRLQECAEDFSHRSILNPLFSILTGCTNLLIGLFAFALLPISAMMPAATYVFPAGVDAHIAHVQTRHHYKLSDAEYAARLLPVLIDEKSHIKSSYDPLTGQWRWERKTRLPTGREVRTRMTNGFYTKLQALKMQGIEEQRFERALEMRAHYQAQRRFEGWTEMSPPLIPSDKLVFTYVLGSFIVDSHEENLSEDPSDAHVEESWQNDSGAWTLFWLLLMVPLGTFCWMRFWILGLFLALFKLLPINRRVALAKYSEETRNTWSSFLVGYYLLPTLFGLLFVLLTDFSVPEEIRTALAIFHDDPEQLWPVWILVTITGLMISTAFYRAVEWIGKGVLIGALGEAPWLLAFVVTNLVATGILLTVEIALPAVFFALLTSAYLEVHPKLVAGLVERWE